MNNYKIAATAHAQYWPTTVETYMDTKGSVISFLLNIFYGDRVLQYYSPAQWTTTRKAVGGKIVFIIVVSYVTLAGFNLDMNNLKEKQIMQTWI